MAGSWQIQFLPASVELTYSHNHLVYYAQFQLNYIANIKRLEN